MALDELTVRLASADLVPLLIEEVVEVDGVVVEDVRLLPRPLPDPRLDGLEAATALVEQVGSSEVLAMLAHQACRIMGADWAVVVDLDGGLCASVGTAWATVTTPYPEGPSHGQGEAEPGQPGLTSDNQAHVARGSLTRSGFEVVLGRSGRPLRQRERSYLAHLARIADRRWSELEAVAAPG